MSIDTYCKLVHTEQSNERRSPINVTIGRDIQPFSPKYVFFWKGLKMKKNYGQNEQPRTGIDVIDSNGRIIGTFYSNADLPALVIGRHLLNVLKKTKRKITASTPADGGCYFFDCLTKALGSECEIIAAEQPLKKVFRYYRVLVHGNRSKVQATCQCYLRNPEGNGFIGSDETVPIGHFVRDVKRLKESVWYVYPECDTCFRPCLSSAGEKRAVE